MGIIRGKVYQPQWTEFKDGVPVRGVGYRGYWTNRATVGGPFPFKQKEDGTWYNPETGLDCKVLNLKEFLKINKRD